MSAKSLLILPLLPSVARLQLSRWTLKHENKCRQKTILPGLVLACDAPGQILHNVSRILPNRNQDPIIRFRPTAFSKTKARAISCRSRRLYPNCPTSHRRCHRITGDLTSVDRTRCPRSEVQ